MSYKIYHPAADHSGNLSGYMLGAGSYVPVGTHSFGQMLARDVEWQRQQSASSPLLHSQPGTNA